MKRLLLLVALLGCEPSVRGRCAQNSDCDTDAGVFCDDKTNICIAASGTCHPACAAGQLCSAGACANLKPVVTVTIDSSALIGPASPDVTVNVQAAASIALQGLSVEVDAAGVKVASGSMVEVVAGDNTVELSSIKTGAVGPVAVTATLRFGSGESVRSVAVPATIDAAPPSVSLSVAPAGWVARSGAPLTVTAAADDGAGSGLQSASLTLDGCTSCAAVAGQTAAGGFTFQVPRTVQAAGSEAAVAFTVTVLDRAQNPGIARGVLQIDDAPPAIHAFTTVVAGATGEDGNPWFAGGSTAAAVEIAVPVADSGSGFAAMTIAIDPTNLAVGTTLAPPASSVPGDGTVHFMLPATAFTSEGPLAFTLTAKDKVGNQSTRDGKIFVDAVPPTVIAPQVDYANAAPALATVCGDSEGASFNCGRRIGTALLPDDRATVSFDVVDCGSGLPNDITQISAAVGSTAKTVTAAGTSGSCRNPVHHYTFTVDAAQDVAISSGDDSGSANVALTANAPDRLGNTGGGGSGSALFSLWRWRRKLGSNITASPALLPGSAGARQVAVGTDATSASGNNNGFVVGPDGSLPQSVSLFAQAAAGDVAVSSLGNIYVTNGGNRLGIFSGTDVCGSTTATLGASPVLVTANGKDTAYLLSTAAGSGNFLTYTWDGNNCGASAATLLVPGGGGFTGASLAGNLLFGSHAQGFSSFDLSSANAQVSYNGSLPAPAPPSIAGSAAFFASADATDHTVHRTKAGTCSVVLGCWNDDGASFGKAGAALLYAPVFDGANLWNADGSGVVYRWALSGGAPQTATLTGVPTGPALMQDGSALVVQKDGPVTLIAAAMTTAKLINLGTFTGALTPVVDARGGFGVAYVPAPSGWLYALQTPSPPAQATPTNWPRPGHDSCNSRNAGSSCP